MRLAPHVMPSAAALALAIAGAVAPAAAHATTLESLSRFKRTQVRTLAAEPMRERREHLRELRELAERLRRSGDASLRRPGARARRAREGDETAPGPAPARHRAGPTGLARVDTPPRANVRCNDPATDYAGGEGQCETAIVRWHQYMIAAWNDGRGFDAPDGQLQGWATSVDSGRTWVDRGSLPQPPGSPAWHWNSDPVLAVNSTTGTFYYSGLADPTPATSAVGVIRGQFSGTSFAWETPTVASVADASTDLLDKEWLAIDPVNGRAYVTYSRFSGAGSSIEFVTSDGALSSWSGPVRLSDLDETGRVQGSRPVVGTGGVVYVVYYLIGTTDTDAYRICRSDDFGGTWTVPMTAVEFYPNYGTGAPGYNRDVGIPQFPSIAVDRSGGTHDGRIHLGWSESLDWFRDEPNAGTGGDRVESEPDDSAAVATPAIAGQTLHGALSPRSDFDYWAIPLVAGQTLLAEMASVSANETVTMRLFASDGRTRLCLARAMPQDIVPGYAPPLWIYTAPIDGTYYLRVAGIAGSGAYTVRTGLVARGAERGRDQRDVFAAHSDDGGITWSTPVRVSNSPVGYDDWLPEVAVTADGQVYCAWYDWRDAAAGTCGGESNTYLAHSTDGGDTWAVLGATSDATSPWSSVVSNVAPNQGDYMSLFADAGGLTAAWSDGRDGKPNVYMAYWNLGETSAQPVLTRADAALHAVQLAWSVDQPAGFAATLQRHTASDPAWQPIASLLSDAAGTLAYTDTTVTFGERYYYRLAVLQGGVTYYYGNAYVVIPGDFALSVQGAWPNPAGAHATIAFTLANGTAATLTVLDASGRRVSERAVGQLGPGLHVLPLADGDRMRPGMYFVRVTQSGRASTRRVVVL